MSYRTSHRALPAAMALTACLLAAGCSSSTPKKSVSSNPPGSVGSTSAPSSATAPSSTTGTTGASVPAASGSSRAAAAVHITIKNFAYRLSGSAAAASMVRVTNNDGEAHTVTADSGSAFDVTVPPGKTVSFAAPKKGGSYPFHCNFHSDMHGTLVVTG